MSLTTIFFDAGGTIVFPDAALTLAALAELHLFPSEEQLYAAERDAKRQFDAARDGHHSVDAQYWDLYYLSLFRELGIGDDAGLRAALVAAARVSRYHVSAGGVAGRTGNPPRPMAPVAGQENSGVRAGAGLGSNRMIGRSGDQ